AGEGAWAAGLTGGTPGSGSWGMLLALQATVPLRSLQTGFDRPAAIATVLASERLAPSACDLALASSLALASWDSCAQASGPLATKAIKAVTGRSVLACMAAAPVFALALTQAAGAGS